MADAEAAQRRADTEAAQRRADAEAAVRRADAEAAMRRVQIESHIVAAEQMLQQIMPRSGAIASYDQRPAWSTSVATSFSGTATVQKPPSLVIRRSYSCCLSRNTHST